MPSDRVDGEKGVGKVDGEIVRVGESAGGHDRDARDGMAVFRCIRYRLVKLQVDDHQSRDGASNACERYFGRLISVRVLGRAGNGRAGNGGSFVIFQVSSCR
jgi:hypothetical protein